MNWLDKKEHDDKIRYEEKLKEEERKKKIETKKHREIQRKIQREKEIKKEIHELIPGLKERFLMILQRFAHPSPGFWFPNSPREIISEYRKEIKLDIISQEVGYVEKTFLEWKLIKPYSPNIKTSHDAIVYRYKSRPGTAYGFFVPDYDYRLSERLESLFFDNSFCLSFDLDDGKWKCNQHGSLLYSEQQLEIFHKKIQDYDNDRYLLYGLNRKNKDEMKKLSSSKEIIQVKEEIISEIENYNNRIDELMKFEDVNDLRSELIPYINEMSEKNLIHLFGIKGYRCMFNEYWEDVPKTFICIMIIIDALSKIKGNPYNNNIDANTP